MKGGFKMTRSTESAPYTYHEGQKITDPIMVKSFQASNLAEKRAQSRIENGESPDKVLKDFNAELDRIMDDFVKEIGIRPG